MRMNALIPMQAQGVDVVGSMARGAQARGQMQQAQTQNALTQFMQEQGPALARGEQGAIDGYARFDPAGAFDMRSQINEAARVAQERATAAAEKLNAEQRAAEEANINRILSIVGTAYRQGPEAIEAAKAQYGQALAQANIDPTQLTYDTIPLFVAGLVGAKNGLKAGLDASEALQPKGPDWRAASPEEAARYGAQAGQINDKTGEFKRTPLDRGMSVTVGENGEVQFTQGPGVGMQAGVPSGQNPAGTATPRQGATLSKELSKDDADFISSMRNAANAATDLKSLATQMLTVQPDVGYTGPGGELVGRLDDLATAVGAPDLVSEGNAGARGAFTSMSMEARLSFTEKTKGAITDREMADFKAAAPGMLQTQEGNQMIAEVMRAGAARVQTRAAFYENWARKHGSLEGAQEVWNEYMDDNPIISRGNDGGLMVNEEGEWIGYLNRQPVHTYTPAKIATMSAAELAQIPIEKLNEAQITALENRFNQLEGVQ